MNNKNQILDIAMNLNRIGNWAADDYQGKKKRINLFLDQTTRYVDSLDEKSFQGSFKRTYNKFLKEYPGLVKAGKQGPKESLHWAEKMMTWGNILTHRAQLI